MKAKNLIWNPGGGEEAKEAQGGGRDLLVGIEDLSPCGANGKLQQPSSKDK